jgi:hypothetical protein
MEQVEDILEDLIEHEADDADEFEVFNVEDLIAEDEIFDEIVAEAELDGEGSTVRRRRRLAGPKRYIPRNREQAHDDLVANYFSANPIYTDEMFRRRFRMNRPLFLRIVDGLSNWSPYFTQTVFHRFRSVRRLLGCLLMEPRLINSMRS